MTDAKKTKTVPESEEEILKFWQENKIFEKSVAKEAPCGDYSFYDGPPFATGLPHYGHIVASLMKDAVPRYWTMRGYRVRRKWGWDCHGLPIENIVEKEFNLKTKKDIEAIGIDKFNELCRSKVMTYADEWKKIIPRVGRFVDMDNDYKTMDLPYMESLWWVFKILWDKNLIYKGYKPMHICPRCATTLSNFEVAQGYKEIEDISATVKFKLTEEPDTYVLAWTTTPWTLPGNVALAVGEKIDYVKIKTGESFLVLAEETTEKVFKNTPVEIVEKFKGGKLVGKSYEPLFPYFDTPENRERGFKIYAADFVATAEGTGVVHIAPAFGEDDMALGQKEKLPWVQHVTMTGNFTDEVRGFAGESVKPIDSHRATDEKIITWLEKNNLLFASEKYIHSYPHCWRCDTPLLNYAASSWFARVTDIKKSLLKNNEKTNWVPDHIKHGRFGKWLEEAKDWALSRTRYWGTPLPVWECACGEKIVLGSVDELRQAAPDTVTKIIMVRHGESDKNTAHIFDASIKSPHGLTKNGAKQTKEAAKKISKEKGELVIYASPIKRTKETAEIIAAELKLPINYAEELIEINNGEWEGKAYNEVKDREDRIAYKKLTPEEQYTAKRGKTGESWEEQEKRMYNFVQKILEKEKGKTIILVSHQGPLIYLEKAIRNLTVRQALGLFAETKWQDYAEPMNLYLDPTTKKEFDLHKHVVDKINITCPKCGADVKRIPEVFDCWFESGSMPYAQLHYPFENQEKFKNIFPAQFIAEGADQTRGWFYTLMVLATALFDKPAFQNVIVNGIVLAEDGQKMSKRLKNYPDPMEIVARYGADAMRYYLLSSPVMKAETLNFSEKGVDEIYKKVILLLQNVFSFFSLYDNKQPGNKSQNVLDRWINAKLEKLIQEITVQMDNYDLVRASRPLENFINEFSTWYLRRSRDRFKGENENDKLAAIATTRNILLTLVKLMAPFTPFIAEKIYQEIKLENDPESVHLSAWPEYDEKLIDEGLIDKMTLAQKIVEAGLAARAAAGIKIRQPLPVYTTTLAKDLDQELIEILKDELNVKEIAFGEAENLDTTISPELRLEGITRDLIRQTNAIRKQAGLTINDLVKIYYFTADPETKNAIVEFDEKLKKETLSEEWLGEKLAVAELFQAETKINGADIWIGIKK